MRNPRCLGATASNSLRLHITTIAAAVQVTEALAFYDAHRGEIEASLADEQTSELVNA